MRNKLEDDDWFDSPPKPSLIHVVFDLLLSPTYRLPRTVNTVRIYHDNHGFSVCPRCKNVVEREYQRYCNCCGQYLDWSKLDEAKKEFIGWDGMEKND